MHFGGRNRTFCTLRWFRDNRLMGVADVEN